MEDPGFAQIYNPGLLAELEAQFGPFAQQHVEHTAHTEVLQRMVHKMANRPRYGEVVMVVPNEAGHIWLHTKQFYPQGVYRLLTGGLEGTEKPHQALAREVEEETGFKVTVDRCLAVITYTVHSGPLVRPFVSYVFLTTPGKGQPVAGDPNEPISDFRAVPPAELAVAAQRLRALDGDFADWGRFRAVAHEAAWEQLQKVG
ncbi:MAG: NUDIX hydrolase [Chloroflexi bacterium]|nr:MAG: NUDIX hydrolase [Chloroflexota bacterium]